MNTGLEGKFVIKNNKTIKAINVNARQQKYAIIGQFINKSPFII